MLRAAMAVCVLGLQVTGILNLRDEDVLHADSMYATTTMTTTFSMADRQDTVQEPSELPQFRSDGAVSITTTDGASHTLSTEFPNCYGKFMEGLMWRKDMCNDCAMIFKWAQEQPQGLSFWMENTPLALDIIYANADGEVVSVKQLSPGDTRGVQSGAPAMTAIEVKQGIAAELGITAGARLALPDPFPLSAFVCNKENCPLIQ